MDQDDDNDIGAGRTTSMQREENGLIIDCFDDFKDDNDVEDLEEKE